MAAHGARRLQGMIRNLNVILGVELICAAQGIEFRHPLQTSAPLTAVMKRLRKQISTITEDRFLAPDLERAAKLMSSQDILVVTGLSFPELWQCGT